MSDPKKDLDDVTEFTELAGNMSDPNTPDAPFPSRRNSSKVRAADEAEVNPSDTPDTLTQYARSGSVFHACGPTKGKLPPGIYNVIATQTGVAFESHKVVHDKLLNLPDSRSAEVVKEIEKFWTLKENFQRFGFSHKRGILLFGPPGGGKSSTVILISKQMEDLGGVVMIPKVGPSILSAALKQFRTVEPDRPAVVVLEDLDAYMQGNGEDDVLSLLDGENSIANVVFLATTNYPERLEGRVVNRPSRFDKIIKIGMPNVDARRMYIASREIGLSPEELDRWAKATEGLSIAHIKELIIGVKCFMNDFDAEIIRLKGMSKKPTSDSEGYGVGFTKSKSDW